MSIITGVPLEEIIATVGHDGSREITSQDPPWNREAFVFSEMALAALKLGWSLSCMYAAPANEGEPGLRTAWPEINELLAWIHERFDCILCVKREGRDHAIAWKRRDDVPVDPNPQSETWDWSEHTLSEIDVLTRVRR